MLNSEAEGKLTLEKLAENMPGVLLVYKANETEDIIFVSKEIIRLFECETIEEFMKFTGGSFSYLVYPEDLENTNKVIKEQIENFSKNNEKDVSSANDYVRYRIMTRNGNIKFVEDWGRLVHDEELGFLYYVYISDIGERERLEKITQTQDSQLTAHSSTLSLTDELTGLASLEALAVRENNFVFRIFETGKKPSLIYLNIRNFHTYNETYGNEGGDRLLKTIARILQDTFTNSLIARIDGDHFVVITSKDDLNDRISRMITRVNNIRKGVKVEIKAGICKIKDNKSDLRIARERARVACENIKLEYGSSVQFCE